MLLIFNTYIQADFGYLAPFFFVLPVPKLYTAILGIAEEEIFVFMDICKNLFILNYLGKVRGYWQIIKDSIS